MKVVIVVFALIERLVEPADHRTPEYGQRIEDGDYVGYLFKDQPDPGGEPPEELEGKVVLLLQHMGGSKNHRLQRRWLDRAKPRIVFRLEPPFMHVGEPRRKLRSLFVDGANETLREVAEKLYFQKALDLLEQALAWNALMRFLPEQRARSDAEGKRNIIAEELNDAGVMDKNLALDVLGPEEWESRLRAHVAVVSDLLQAS